MPTIKLDNNRLYFRQSNLPVMFFVILFQLGYQVEITGDKRYPYAVGMSESDFQDVILLAQETITCQN